MGIPSYFSQLVKSHPTILRRISTHPMSVDNLYMDCNSAIYDAYYSLAHTNTPVTNSAVIRRTVDSINHVICQIRPSKTLILAFDGVAPVAKLEQQRVRRMKTLYQKTFFADITAKSCGWDTTCITPGTEFMKELDAAICSTQFYAAEIHISPSGVAGEGEHKIMSFIRQHPDKHRDQTTVIYGLDADLIMLSLSHLYICPNLYLFRETPEFAKSLDASLEANELYAMNISTLSEWVVRDLTGADMTRLPTTLRYRYVQDYVFLCFMLGNDFLPHFPALNIRTGGLTKLFNVYRETMYKNKLFLVSQTTICWKHVKKIIKIMSACEQSYICEEYSTRGKYTNKSWSIDNVPRIDRVAESIISPDRCGWEERYYRQLFSIQREPDRMRQISINYIEGLEWTLKYYLEGCPDWNWKYKYQYPPLLVDLVNFVPYLGNEHFSKISGAPVDELVQLLYVLPVEKRVLLPTKLARWMDDAYPPTNMNKCEFQWAFCRYFWESHPVLPEVDIATLVDTVALFKRNDAL